MSTLNGAKYAALLDLTNASQPRTLNELEVLWLRDVQGYTGTLNEMWIQEFLTNGGTAGNTWVGNAVA